MLLIHTNAVCQKYLVQDRQNASPLQFLRFHPHTKRATVIVDKEGVVRYVKVYDIPQQRQNQELVEVLKSLS